MKFWMVKQEPEAYSWNDLERDGKTAWTGVRNYQARNNLRAMQPGEPVLFYHSVSEKSVVGLARVLKAAYPDPTAEGEEGDWCCVELGPWVKMKEPLALAAIKEDSRLKSCPLVKNSRLSVLEFSQAEFERVLQLCGTALPKSR